MRVYELGKELGVPNKELVAWFNENGITVKGHMSSVDDAQADSARAVFGKTEEAAPEPEPTPEPTPEPEIPAGCAYNPSGSYDMLLMILLASGIFYSRRFSKARVN